MDYGLDNKTIMDELPMKQRIELFVWFLSKTRLLKGRIIIYPN